MQSQLMKCQIEIDVNLGPSKQQHHHMVGTWWLNDQLRVKKTRELYGGQQGGVVPPKPSTPLASWRLEVSFRFCSGFHSGHFKGDVGDLGHLRSEGGTLVHFI